MRRLTLAAATAAASLSWVMAVHSDEGMWPLDAPPKKALKDRYGFELWREMGLPSFAVFELPGFQLSEVVAKVV